MTEPGGSVKVAQSELSRCAMCDGPVEYVMGGVRCRRCGLRGPHGLTREKQAACWEEMQRLLRRGKALKDAEVEVEAEAEVPDDAAESAPDMAERMAKVRGARKSGKKKGGGAK